MRIDSAEQLHLPAFGAANPAFDVLRADLLDDDALDRLDWTGSDREEAVPTLRRLQRLLRIEPDLDTVARLLDHGFDSAQHVARMPRTRFVELLGAELNGGRAHAARVYDSALTVKSRAMHLVANVHGLASPHFRGMRANHLDDALPSHFESLSSYEEIFGSLDYCECPECASILGPAAYLVDLRRIIDLAVTQANTIQAGLAFDARRPDIGTIALTCANTEGEVPYLQIVAAVLEQTVGPLLNPPAADFDAVYRALATAVYPFGLPFNLPLTRIRRYLDARGASLAGVYSAFETSDALAAEEAREILGLTAESFAALAPPSTAQLAAVVSADYASPVGADDLRGLDHLDVYEIKTGLQTTDIQALLTQGLGPQELYDTSGVYGVTAGKGTKLTLVQDGAAVTGTYDANGGSVEGVMQGPTLAGTWQETSGDATVRGSFALTFAADGGSFTGAWATKLGATGTKTDWSGTRDPSTPSTQGLIPHSLFVNHVLGARQYLQLTRNVSDPDNPYEQITGQSLATLDTLSRFIRLARALGWSWADLDWTLTSIRSPVVDGSGNITSGAELDAPTLVELAKVVQLVEGYGLPLPLVQALSFDLKTTGRGSGASSAAPFDLIFNDPTVLAQSLGRAPYHPEFKGTGGFPNPLYRDTVQDWTIGSTGGGTPAGQIVASLPAAPGDLQRIAVALFGADATVPLTVANLSALHRHTALATELGLDGGSYVTLAGLVGLAAEGSLPLALDRDQTLKLLTTARWIAGTGLSVDDGAYIVAGTAAPSVTIGYDPAGLPGFLAGLAQFFQPALVSAATFESQLVDGPTAEAVLQPLINQGYVDPLGVVAKDPAATAPDLSDLAGYAPAIGALSAAQQVDVLARLSAARARQQASLGSQLSGLLGLAQTAAVTLAAGSAAWLRLADPVEPFMTNPLFSVAPASVFVAGALDPARVQAAFGLHGITLEAVPEIDTLTVTSWEVTATENDAAVGFTAVMPDGETVTFYAPSATAGTPAAEVLTALTSDVLTAGALDPAKVTAAFAAQTITLSATAVTPLVQPLAWRIADPGTGIVYGATQPGGGSAPVGFAGPSAAETTAPAPVAAIVEAISRFAVLMNSLDLSVAAMATAFADPTAFEIDDNRKSPLAFTLKALHAARTYAELEARYSDSAGLLGQYLLSTTRSVAQLCRITGWDNASTAYLCTQLLGGTPPSTVSSIARLVRVFDIAAATGASVYTLGSLYAARDMTATDGSWQTMGALADGLLQAVRTGTPESSWATTQIALEAPILEARRDALVSTAVWKLGLQYEDITTTENLYEFLLLDVKMAGCAQISPVKEALNASQLYLQRCRLNLEAGVSISTDNLPDVWWEWLLNYRVWEANREIFLYPENYIDPGLRRSSTQLFDDLQNSLLQAPITADSVNAAFHKYLDAFAAIAALEHVDSYHAVVEDAQKGPIDTLFLFSRTSTQPYKFYYAARQRLVTAPDCDGGSAYTWSEWLPIDITIDAALITPVYVFGKLFVLWVELSHKLDQDGSSNTTGRYDVTAATVKLSYLSPAGVWMQPQTVLSDQVVNVEPGTAGANALYGPFSHLFEDTTTQWWTKVAAVRVGPSARAGGGDERLCIYFGPLFDTTIPSTPAPGAPNPNADAQTFANTMNQACFVRSQITGMSVAGKVAINPTLVLDANLVEATLTFDDQYVIVQPDTRSDTSPPTFRPGLNGPSLFVAPERESVYNDYVAGTSAAPVPLVPPEMPLSASAFTSDLVSATQSANYYKALTTFPNDVIGENGVVKSSALKLTTGTVLTLLGSGATAAMAREVRETLWAGYYGFPVLFGQAVSRNATVLPTRNQPGTFLFLSGDEAFLIESASAAGAVFAMADAALRLEEPFQAVTPEAFVSRDITPAQSRAFYTSLTTYPNDVIYAGDPNNANGVVKTSGKQLTAGAAATVILSDLGRAQQVVGVLGSTYGPAGLTYAATGFAEDDSVFSLQFGATRLSTSAIQRLQGALYAGGVDALLTLPAQQIPVPAQRPFVALGPAAGDVESSPSTPLLVPPAAPYGDQVDFAGPYGLYYWELFFHAPFLVANMLHANQQFQAAERWYQYVFDPTRPPEPLTQSRLADLLPPDLPQSEAAGIYTGLKTWVIDGAVTATALTVAPSAIVSAVAAAGVTISTSQATELRDILANEYRLTPETRYWRFQPFRNQTLETLAAELQNCAEIAAYNDDPFDPHAIARLRVGAYEKAIVMAYVTNLLDWGDQEFTQYTWESITTARMLYVYAYDLLGPRPEDLGPCDEAVPTTYDDIRARYSDEASKIPQFTIKMENALGGGGQGQGPLLGNAGVPFNDVGGVFCIPENDQLSGMWDRVEDRLHKIDNCLNILGQAQPLPLFSPPINPADLVRAAAAGGALGGLEGQLQPLVPNYRFATMVERAEEMTETVRSFGAALLSALERHDAERLALVRAAQEVGVLNMVTLTRQRAIDDLQGQLGSLQQGLVSAQYRQQHYASLIAAGLNAAEITNLELTGASLVAKAAAMPFYGLSIAGYLTPDIYGLSNGGMKFGDAISAGAQIATAASDMLSQSAGLAETIAQNQRRAEEWQLQEQVAQYEVAQLTQQIAATNARIAGAQQDLAINAREIANATQVEALMRTSFTNQDLYAWMTGRIATVYFQAFRMAQELALAAQTAYQFELDRDDQFVTFGTWDDLHRGLLAGEGLLLSLKQLRKAYVEDDTRRLEIEKTVSLRQTFPLAFAGFKWGYPMGDASAGPGRLDFTLSESLFDFDYPGHYNRKIKSISVSLPSVVGPYQDFHLTLTQNANLIVTDPDPAAVDYAIKQTSAAPPAAVSPPAGTVRQGWAPNQSIAVSRGVDDSGLFQLDFRDERYLPFEGTGAVSSWTLSLPPATNRINFDNISDVVLKVRYSAQDGGSAFASRVQRLYAQSGDRYAYLRATTMNLSQSYSAQWNQFFARAPVSGKQTMTFQLSPTAVLPNLAGVKLHNVLLQLEVAGDAVVTSEAGKPFLALQVDGAPATPLGLPVSNNFAEVGTANVAELGSTWTGVTWSLQFDTTLTPSALLSNGALDPDKLLDMAFVVTYTATPFVQGRHAPTRR
ncbi:MAG TPA: neuraminidase-like domain-containing protein [Solirubrobacteraceae bacterium]